MPSVFISYSHDSADLSHGERVAGLAAALLRDGFKVFFDQNRNGEEEGVPWPIWMEDRIDAADFVLLVCTDLYLKMVRQEVQAGKIRAVCGEAGLIYHWLYEERRNSAKFVQIVLTNKERPFVPRPLRGVTRSFVLDTQWDYQSLCCFLTKQHRPRLSDTGVALPGSETKEVSPLFAPAAADTTRVAVPVPDKSSLKTGAVGMALKRDTAPAPRRDIRGLDWYEECDAGHFLGREEDANRILAMLLSHPIIRLTGPSGVGKSSLIRAGLLPRIREFGWRACVIRPFDDPARQVPAQLAAELTEGGEFSVPLVPAELREQLSALLEAAKVSRLVILVDQFEDIVSPLAAKGALETMRDWLSELWNHGESRPPLRVVLACSTEAEARLGRLWQEISGRADGLPYHSLEGLPSGIVEKILRQTAADQGWKTEVEAPEIVQQLASESRKVDCVGDVFPVNLQVFQKQAASCPEGLITAACIETLGGSAGSIGKYLEQSLAKLQARGGDWQRCRTILECLSRATGSKAMLSLSELTRETCLSATALAEMLTVLIDERLVRLVGHDIYEIQHDRLGAAVIESMQKEDRDTKAARDFLAAKAHAFEQARTLLTTRDLIYIYRHRQKIHPSETELRMILASLFSSLEWDHNGDYRDPKPIGWFWFQQASDEQWWERLLQIERWAADKRSSIKIEHLWARLLPLGPGVATLAVWAHDPSANVRRVSAEVLGREPLNGNLGILAKLAKDMSDKVRLAAVVALQTVSPTDALPLLRGLAEDQDFGVRQATAAILAHIPPVDALPLLRELVKDKEFRVRMVAAAALATLPPACTLTLLLGLDKDSNYDLREAFVPALVKLPLADALPLLHELAKDEDPGTRQVTASVLAEIPLAEALPLWHRLVRDDYAIVQQAAVRALAKFPPADVPALLHELVRDKSDEARWAAAIALESVPTVDSLPLLCELVKDESSRVRQAAATSLATVPVIDALPLLYELAKDEDSEVRRAVAAALAKFPPTDALPLLGELSEDQDHHVRRASAISLAASPVVDALPLLRELAKDEDSGVRRAVAAALGALPLVDAQPLLRELVLSSDANVVRESARSLAQLLRRNELEDFLERYEAEMIPEAMVEIDAVLYKPEWLKNWEAERRKSDAAVWGV